MYLKLVVRACNKNFAQHLLSYHSATKRGQKKLMEIKVLLPKSTGTKH